jgi:hypothetical protein
VTRAGAEAQDVEDYRAEVIEAYQTRGQGGAPADYRLWGKTVPTVAQIYHYKSDLPGSMDIFVEVDPTELNPDGLASQGTLDAVEAAIRYDDAGLASRMPAGVEELEMASITRTSFDVEISGLTPSTAECRSAIESAISEHMRSREPFILGLSALPRKDMILYVDVAGIASSVASAHGASFTALSLYKTGYVNPMQSAFLEHGEKAKLGTATFI